MNPSGFDAIAVRAPRAAGPWSSDHLSRVLLGNAGGLVLLGTSWWQVSGTGSVRMQVTWLVAGIAGVGVAGLVNATWLLRGLQSVSAGRDLVLPSLAGARRRRARRASITERSDRDELVTVDGTQRFHRPSCPLALGKRAAALDERRDRSSLIACEVCEP